MPKKPKKIKRPWVNEYKPFERRVDNSRFYNSWSWRKLRKRFLDKNPLCVECSKGDVVVVATVADHVVPITLGGAKLDEDNLQALCKHHHNKKSSNESRWGKGGK